MLLSKSKFADYIGVTPSRVSQYISAGLIGPEALVGQGRGAKIDVRAAVLQLRERRHVGQAIGNGWRTRLELPAVVSQQVTREPRPDDPAPDDPSVTGQLLVERLEGLRRRNRQEAEAELAVRRSLVSGAEVQRLKSRVAAQVADFFTGMAPDIGEALARRFDIPEVSATAIVAEAFASVRIDRRSVENRP